MLYFSHKPKIERITIMKKRLIPLLTALLCVLLAGCNHTNNPASDASTSESSSVKKLRKAQARRIAKIVLPKATRARRIAKTLRTALRIVRRTARKTVVTIRRIVRRIAVRIRLRVRAVGYRGSNVKFFYKKTVFYHFLVDSTQYIW